jgi:hypothetical protein
MIRIRKRPRIGPGCGTHVNETRRETSSETEAKPTTKGGVGRVWVGSSKHLITNVLQIANTILVPRVFLGKTLVLSGHVTLQKLIAQGGVAKCQITCFHTQR